MAHKMFSLMMIAARPELNCPNDERSARAEEKKRKRRSKSERAGEREEKKKTKTENSTTALRT